MTIQKTVNIISLLALTGLIFGAGCTKPRPERSGCVADLECQGTRICSEAGICVDQNDSADTSSDTDASADAGHNTDAHSEDPPDADTHSDADTQPDADTPCPDTAPIASATIASDDTPAATSIEVGPGASVQLDGRASSASVGEIADYQWSFVEFPYSTQIPRLEPKLRTRADGTASFEALTIGSYTLDLTVVGENGESSCEPARVQVEVEASARIYVELVWDTPADDDPYDNRGADLDLHYKHPAGEWAMPDSDLDIFWYVRTADWGIRGDSSDDPQLLRDDEDGWGPEAIAHPNADPLTYNVGIYYYDDHGFGPSYATLRVYLDGALASEVRDIEMENKYGFYEALSINAANNSIEYDDEHYDDYPPID